MRDIRYGMRLYLCSKKPSAYFTGRQEFKFHGVLNKSQFTISKKKYYDKYIF